jgi:hypothetical protein
VALRDDPPNRGLECAGRGIFGHERRGASLERGRLHERVVERGDDNDERLRHEPLHPAADLQTVDVGHHQIDDGDVRLQSRDRVDRFLAIGYGRDDIARPQQSLERSSDLRMVVRYHDPHALLSGIKCHLSGLFRSLAFADTREEGSVTGSDVGDAGTIRPNRAVPTPQTGGV